VILARKQTKYGLRVYVQMGICQRLFERLLDRVFYSSSKRQRQFKSECISPFEW
jgi:hypothetical protein